MNYTEKNYVGTKGGHDGTYFEVLGQHEGKHIDYPAYDENGKEKGYHEFMEGAQTAQQIDVALKEYFAAKKERTREAVILTITGNAVSCEWYLKEQGFKAFAVGPNEVHVYGDK